MDNLMTGQKGKWEIVNRCLLLIAFFYVVLFPTSIGGVISDNMWMPRNMIAFVVVLYIVFKNGVKRTPFIVALFLVGLLILLTFTTYLFSENSDLRVAYASISAFVSTLAMWCITFQNTELSEKFVKIFLNVFTALLCIWGLALAWNNEFAVTFTQTWYSQLTEDMFENMILIRGKPVMSFGTHSMAAFFLLIVYFYNCIMIREKKNSFLQYIYLGIIIYLEFCLRSNTAILAIVAMFFLLIWAKNNILTRMFLATVIVIVVYSVVKAGHVEEFLSYILQNPQANKHGLEGRYFSGMFDGNFEIVSQYFGVGFLRSQTDYFDMHDSGIIYIFTQGNIPALIMSYSLMYFFLRRNLVKHYKKIFILFFVWEIISASTFISVKMIFAQIMTIFIINNLCRKKETGVKEIEGT